ncbi:MAG: hypothetical protein ACW99F_11665, partial [Candidatus Hodarchaeales archaeon]
MDQIKLGLSQFTQNLNEEKDNQVKLLEIEKVIVSSLEKLEKSTQDANLQLNQQENEIKLYNENKESISNELNPLKLKLEER